MKRAQTATVAIRARLGLKALLVAVNVLFANAVFAQEAQPDPVPEELSAQDKQDLESRRASLMQQREALLAKIKSHNGKCGKVPEDSPLVTECRGDHAALGAEVKRYQDAVAEFNRVTSERVARAKEKLDQCQAVAHQAQKDRQQIENLRRTTDVSQEELAEWTRLNEQAQKKAVVAAVKFTLGEFTANIETVRGSVSKLERHASYLAKKAAQSRKYKTRMQYAAQLEATFAQLEPKWGELMEREIVKTALGADKAWNLARNTMHHEFRVARKHNDAMREILMDPGFREAFTGDDLDAPGLDVLASLTQQAGEELGKLELGLERYQKFTGPVIRAAVFVRDASYSALLSGLSTARVLQQSEVAGDLARATAALQKQYKKSIDALHACRQAGYGG